MDSECKVNNRLPSSFIVRYTLKLIGGNINHCTEAIESTIWIDVDKMRQTWWSAILLSEVHCDVGAHVKLRV